LAAVPYPAKGTRRALAAWMSGGGAAARRSTEDGWMGRGGRSQLPFEAAEANTDVKHVLERIRQACLGPRQSRHGPRHQDTGQDTGQGTAKAAMVPRGSRPTSLDGGYIGSSASGC
jgi:hypothetical protein